MAAMAKTPYPPHTLADYRAASYSADYASPTNSDFSTGAPAANLTATVSAGSSPPDDVGVREWDVARVSDWLRSIHAESCIDLFRRNDISGECLLDLDKATLKDMGVEKVGDRVRIFAGAKRLRELAFQRRRESARATTPQLDQMATPPPSGSPRVVRIERDDRLSAGTTPVTRAGSRPTSPLHVIDEEKGVASSLASRATAAFAQPSRFNTARPESRFRGHSRVNSLVVDTDVANGTASKDRLWIRAIYDNARSSVFGVDDCKTAEEVIFKTLKKGQLNEGHIKSYCFYVLDGTEAKAAYCRRLSDAELLRICSDPTRLERERLIFRKIHAGEPEGPQLQSAAAIAQSQLHYTTRSSSSLARSQSKLQKLTGEPLPPLSYPMSPASAAERQRHLEETVKGLESGAAIRPRVRRNADDSLFHTRPESELVIADPKLYFPDVSEEKFESMKRMSVRRSQRLSRATNRLSVASSLSYASSLDDAPPLPRIAESGYFGASAGRARPVSVIRPLSVYRDSYASSVLDSLDEESPDPDRKSYISFGDGHEQESPPSATIRITDADGNTVQKSYFSDNGSSPPLTEPEVSSLNEQLTRVLQEDGEANDDELTTFLKPDAWENIPYIRGKLIGQGSFGSVYLALHATTAELMAVKQVELPSSEGTAAVDAKKNIMVEALKREIGLLRELKHKNIVHYLGSSSDANNLNIFLEYVPGGSIAKMLVDYGSLNEDIVTAFVRQILVGLAYLHSKDIIHRDIKGANILVDSHGAVKISDFGISKRVQDSKAALAEAPGTRRGRGVAANRVSLQGSVYWMAPEVVKQTAYTRKADIWSLGCLIVEMLTGSHPHPDLSQLQALFKIGKGAAPSPAMPDGASAAACDFLAMTFRTEHEERPEAEELLATGFVKDK